MSSHVEPGGELGRLPEPRLGADGAVQRSKATTPSPPSTAAAEPIPLRASTESYNHRIRLASLLRAFCLLRANHGLRRALNPLTYAIHGMPSLTFPLLSVRAGKARSRLPLETAVSPEVLWLVPQRCQVCLWVLSRVCTHSSGCSPDPNQPMYRGPWPRTHRQPSRPVPGPVS